MSITPPPPPGLEQPPTSFQQMSNSSTNSNFFRRPRVWVPPVIMLDAFAAGYAIPWDLGPTPGRAFLQFVFPLLLTAIFCGIAGFYSYRTVRGWQLWTWLAFGISILSFTNIWLFPVLMMPAFPLMIFALGTIGLLIAATAGSESLKPIHSK
jgi:hypothetical protein